MNIWFATNNAHKKEELSAILNIQLKIPSEEGIEYDCDETGVSFYENSLLKAKELKKLLVSKGNEDAVIADDSGLCVDCLGGRPGIFSARYGSVNGQELKSAERNLLLLAEIGENPKRSARFICAMTLLVNNEKFFIVQETIEGEIVNMSEIKGEGGFGYDPVFLIPQLGRTMAQLLPEEKNILSHRGKAGKHIAAICQNLNLIRN
ncbi:MAG: non-canonical purine NTP pyrophosphatase [Treponema sp.]|jgi:XTP/dITP diphosphohydrolase|nr:non-canonical purine NTP pyrophosphatase [Treponema sp.]